MAKRKLDELIEARMSPRLHNMLGKEFITHLHQIKLSRRDFVGYMTGEEDATYRDYVKANMGYGSYLYYRPNYGTLRGGVVHLHLHEVRAIDRAYAPIYHDALKAVLVEVCEMTLLCLWKRIGLDKHVVLGICRILWRERKEWMP